MKTRSNVLLKTKQLQLALFTGALILSNSLNAQTRCTSYFSNTTPIGSVGSSDNVAYGWSPLLNNTTGSWNVAIGNYAMDLNTTGSYNTVVGYTALFANTTGIGNSGIGYGVLGYTTGNYNTANGYKALYNNSSAFENTATGYNALYSNTTGIYNLGEGSNALNANSTGSYNSACGAYALYNNTTASQNTGSGFQALYTNSTGQENTAAGYRALFLNTTGSYNVAFGNESLRYNTGFGNSAMGYYALYKNTTTNYNSAFGYYAMYNSTTGTDNAAFGSYSMTNSTTGYGNAAVGNRSLIGNTTGANNVGMGMYTLFNNTTGSNNTALGYDADVSSAALTNATTIGYIAVVNASNKVRIGNASVTVVEGPVAYTFSDGRFKTNVSAEDVKGLEFIKQLRPVVYNLDTKKITEFWTKNMPDSIRAMHLNEDFTASTNIRQSGFIAQEVEQAAKDANYNFNGVHVPENDNDNYSIAYSEFVVPLVKGMQEQQQMIEDQKLMIQNLQQEINELKKAQTSDSGINSIEGSTMEQNVPNPFSHETVIKFNLVGQVTNASMLIYDLSGKQVKSIRIDQRGESSITVTSDQLQAGRYYYSIMADGKLVDSKTMIVIDK